jgi:hypothetical protein
MVQPYTRRLAWEVLGLIGLAWASCLASQPVLASQLQLFVHDETGNPTPCRVLVHSASKSYFPDEATTLTIFPDTWFMSAGESKLELPDGQYTLRIEKGLEYRRVLQSIEIRGTTKKTLQLQRWVNMRERGYACGENHVHMDSVRLAPMLAAECLDFGSSLTWWRGPDPERPIPPGDEPIRTLEFAGRRAPTSIFDAELEYDWGAAYIQNMPRSMPLLAEPGRPNLDYLRLAVESGATVHYQGGWSREVLADALLGYVHVVNICNNNFGLHRFQPRSRYSNLLGVEGFPVYPDTDVGMMQLNMETYNRLLNCGLRLAAGAGTACGVKKAPVGYNRSYVQVAAESTLQEFNTAWQQGRNFVTNGPVLLLRTSQGHQPGDEVPLATGTAPIELRVELLSDQPLKTVELIANGQVVYSKALGDAKAFSDQVSLALDKSTWVAARCTAIDDLLSDAQLARYEDDGNPKGALAKPSRLRFAHTSPIYFLRPGEHEVLERSSLDEGIKMLAALERFAQQAADVRYRADFLTKLSYAHERLLKKIELTHK